MSPRRVLFVVASARRGGNTALLARAAAAALPPDVEQEWLDLNDLVPPVFEDLRHDEERGYAELVAGDPVLGRLLEATLAATDVVLVSPVYWYSVSASAKLYLDHWSGWLRLPDVAFKRRMAAKTLWLVTTLAGEDLSDAQWAVGSVRRSAQYLGAAWGGALVARADRPEDVLGDEEALRRAAALLAAQPVPA